MPTKSSSNFDFLKEHDPIFFQLASTAEHTKRTLQIERTHQQIAERTQTAEQLLQRIRAERESRGGAKRKKAQRSRATYNGSL